MENPFRTDREESSRAREARSKTCWHAVCAIEMDHDARSDQSRARWQGDTVWAFGSPVRDRAECHQRLGLRRWRRGRGTLRYNIGSHTVKSDRCRARRDATQSKRRLAGTEGPDQHAKQRRADRQGRCTMECAHSSVSVVSESARPATDRRCSLQLPHAVVENDRLRLVDGMDSRSIFGLPASWPQIA